jgi:formylglycine-generating enzyme required for sulfatase activity
MKIAEILLICIVCVSISACTQSDEGLPPTEHTAEIVSEIDGATMVLIPAGTFQMGSTIGDSDEQPVHTVTLDAFYMDKYEVTNARYQKFVESTGYPQPPLSHNPRSMLRMFLSSE